MSLPKLEGPRRIVENVKNQANAQDYKNYLEQGVCENLEIHYEGCGQDWVQDFQDKAKLHGKLKNNIAIEFVEAWSPEETKMVTPEVLFQRGIENARAAFPGHDFIVVPHISENGNFHNHVLFCAVSDEGKRLLDNGATRRRWNKVCDAKSREHGLSTVQRTTSEQREKLSRTARKMMRKGKMPYQYQLLRSADFARTIATNMNDFITYMGFMGIEVNVRGKNTISFKHQRQNRPTRGKTLGTLYKKESLDAQFKDNKKQFGSRINLETSLVKKFRDLHDDSGRLVGDSSNFPFVHGGHQRFKNFMREAKETNPLTQSNDNTLGNQSRLSIDLKSIFNDVTNRSISEYCESQKIALVAHNDGSYSLKGKEYIHIKDNRWINKKIVRGKEVGTTGTLLEFVCNHKRLNELEAMSFITGNKRLLQLSQYLNMDKRTYQEFFIPKQDRMNEQNSEKQFTKLAKFLGRKSEVSKFLYRMKSVQVKTDGTIRFLLGKKANGAIEYKQDSKGNWSKRLLGSLRSGVFSQKGSNNKLRLFKDPFVFMQETKGRGNLHYKSGDNILVLGDGNSEALDFFLAKNPKIQNVELFGFDSKNLEKTLTERLKGHEVSFTFMKADGKGHSKDLNLGLSR